MRITNHLHLHSAPPFLVALSLALAGCSWDAYTAPAGHAIIREHVIDAPRNVPPVTSLWDFTILEVDGKAVAREEVPKWVDLPPGVLLDVGEHQFLARVVAVPSPPDLKNMKPPENIAPRTERFVLKVESGKVYLLIGDDLGQPRLAEAKLK